MPVPKRKRSRTRRDKRFANKGLKEVAVTSCAQCTKPLIPHAACRECGFYKGAKMLSTKSDRGVKRLETRKAKEAVVEQPEVVQEPAEQK